MKVISIMPLLGDASLHLSAPHAQLVGGAPLNSFFGTGIYFSSDNSQLVSWRSREGAQTWEVMVSFILHLSFWNALHPAITFTY